MEALLKFAAPEDVFREKVFFNLQAEIKKRDKEIAHFSNLPPSATNTAIVRGLKTRITASKMAMDRIKDGTFGICPSCKQLMSTQVLLGTPWVEDCPDCQKAKIKEQRPAT